MIYNINSNTEGKQDLAFSVICNSSYLPCLGTLLVNLDLVRINYDAFHVLHDGISNKEIFKITKYWPKVVFHKFTLEQFIDHYKIDINAKPFQSFSNRFSYLAYLKFRALELLKFYKKVILCDLDAIFIKNDLSTLLCFSGIAWKQSFDISFGFEKFYRTNDDKCIDFRTTHEFANYSGSEETPNGGFIYISDVIDYEQCLLYGDIFLKKYVNHFYAMIDEIIFTYIVNLFKIPKLILNKNIYNVFPQEVSSVEPVYVHFAGDFKPWSNESSQHAFPLWKVCYLSYLNNFEGERFSTFVDFSPYFDNYYISVTFKFFWLRILNKISFNSLLKYPSDLSKFYLIFDYRDNMYFELKTDFWNMGQISCGFWFKNPLLSHSKSVCDFCNFLNNFNNQMFIINFSDLGVYISTEKFNVSYTHDNFNYFVNIILSDPSPFNKTFLNICTKDSKFDLKQSSFIKQSDS